MVKQPGIRGIYSIESRQETCVDCGGELLEVNCSEGRHCQGCGRSHKASLGEPRWLGLRRYDVHAALLVVVFTFALTVLIRLAS